jgi:hypothetical protein
MTNVTPINTPMGDDNGIGVIRLMSGTLFDLRNPKSEDIHFDDIAWSLSRQVRYNGHIPLNYTVARHSIIMSHYVDPEHAMEALLHDAGEAYLSDVVNPLKQLFPEIEALEDRITAMVMEKFNPCWVSTGEKYSKSDEVAYADRLIYVHECFLFDRPEGVWDEGLHDAEEQAMAQNGLQSLDVFGMDGDYQAFCHRFWQLFEPMYEEML